METLLQVLVFGVLRSGLYALTSLGLALSLGVIGVVNFAHGEFVMLGSFVAFALFLLFAEGLGLGTAASLPVMLGGLAAAGALLFALGAGLFRFTIRPVLRAPELNQMLLTFGVSILMTNATLILLGGESRNVNVGWRFDLVSLGPFNVTVARVAVFVVSLLLVLAVYLLLQRTRVGKAMRAVAQNRLGASLVGIRVDRVYLLAFGLSTALAGMAGAMLAFQSAVHPFVGLSFILKAFSIVVLAGLGNLGGVLWASALLGVSEQIVGQYLPNGDTLKEGLFFVVIFVALLLRARPVGAR